MPGSVEGGALVSAPGAAAGDSLLYVFSTRAVTSLTSAPPFWDVYGTGLAILRFSPDGAGGLARQDVLPFANPGGAAAPSFFVSRAAALPASPRLSRLPCSP